MKEDEFIATLCKGWMMGVKRLPELGRRMPNGPRFAPSMGNQVVADAVVALGRAKQGNCITTRINVDVIVRHHVVGGIAERDAVARVIGNMVVCDHVIDSGRT